MSPTLQGRLQHGRVLLLLLLVQLRLRLQVVARRNGAVIGSLLHGSVRGAELLLEVRALISNPFLELAPIP